MTCFHLKKNQQMRTLSLVKKNKIKNKILTRITNVSTEAPLFHSLLKRSNVTVLWVTTFRRCWYTFVAHTVFVGSFP